MAKSNDRKTAERLYLMLADAIYNALPTDTVEMVRGRVLKGITDEQQAELDAYIAEQRSKYAETESARDE